MTATPTPILSFGPPLAGNDPISQQFMDLFTDGASSWQVASNAMGGVSITENFILTATTQQLTEVLTYLRQNNLQLTMSACQMIPVQGDAGNGQEGYGSTASLVAAVQRISSLGGTISGIGMDSPLSAGHFSPTGAQLSITSLAQQIAPAVAAIQAIFPDVTFADAEQFGSTSGLVQWAQAFQQATGTAISEFDADVDWGPANTMAKLATFAATVASTGATYGLIGNATQSQTSNMSWALSAEANIAAAEANPLTRPATLGITSWDAYPTVLLSEGTSGTLTHVAVEAAEISPLYASGYLTGGMGASVATAVPGSNYLGAAAAAVTNEAVLVPGIVITASGAGAAGATFATVITDVTGNLSAVASGAGGVTGIGTGVLTLTGGLADIDAELASLTYTGTMTGADTIDVTTYDGTGLVDDHQIVVATAAPVPVTLPSGATAASLYQNVFGTAPPVGVLAAAQAALGGGATLTQVAAPWIAQAQADVTALFEQEEGAAPSPSAVATMTGAMLGGESLSQLGVALSTSTSVQQELTTLYQSRYGAPPSGAQISTMEQQLSSGVSLMTVEAPLLAGAAAEATIASLYQQIEGQAPDQTDLVTQSRALLTGTSISTITGELANSAYVQAALVTMYQEYYDTPATTAQLASLTTELTGGVTFAQVQGQFTTSAQRLVASVFASVLGRAPTSAELTTYTTNLTNGITLQVGLWSTLAYSAESTAKVTAIYQQAIGAAPSAAMVTTLEQCLCIGQVPLAQLGPDLTTAATLYQQITGQPLTEAALSPLMYDFLNKIPVSQISYRIAYSDQVVGLLSGAYQASVGQAIDGNTLQTLLAELNAGTATMASVQASLTAQAATEKPLVTAAFASVLSRAPTAAELASNTAQMMTGATAPQIWAALAYSAESTANVTAIYQQVAGAVPSAAMVTTLEQCLCIGQIPLAQLGSDLTTAASLYQRITGQPLTEAALSPLMYDFLNKIPVSQITNRIAYSSQVTGLLNAAYEASVGQAIDANTSQSLMAALNAGTATMASVQASLASQAAADKPLVTSAFASALGRAPTPAELAANTAEMMTGATAPQILAGLAYSAESTANVTAMYQHIAGIAPSAAMVTTLEQCLCIGQIPLAQLGPDLATAASLYQQISGQPLTEAALSPLMYDFLNHIPVSQIAWRIASSPAEVQLVSAAYQQAAGQAPASTMVTQLETLASQGMPFSTIAQDLTQTVSMYEAILGTAPTAAQVSQTMQSFGTGATAAQIAQTLAGSSGSRSTLTAAFQRDFGFAPAADQLTGLVGQLAASSLSTVLAGLTAAAKADIPAIKGTLRTESVPLNAQATPLAAITVSDPEENQSVSATVTLTAGIGRLSGSGGTLASNGQTFTVAASPPALVQSVLRGLTFSPASGATGVTGQISVTLTNAIQHKTSALTSITIEAVQPTAGQNFVFLSGTGDTVSATSMSDVFVVPSAHFGQNVITGFNPAADMIQLPKLAFPTMAAFAADVTAISGGTMIRLDAQDSITLPGVAPASLTAQNIHLV